MVFFSLLAQENVIAITPVVHLFEAALSFHSF